MHPAHQFYLAPPARLAHSAAICAALSLLAKCKSICTLHRFEGGTLERFPNLKLLCLEVGAGWVPHFIERMDSKWKHSGFMTACKRPPSEYFRRQVWGGADPDESMISAASQRWGSDKLFWSTDFPHFDGFPDALNLLKNSIKDLNPTDQQNILGDNAARAYDL